MIDVSFYSSHILAVHASDFDVRNFQEISWQSSKIPFGADIRARSQQHPHFFLLTNPNELSDISVLSFKIKDSLGSFMIVPENINSNGITSHRFSHLYPVPPIFFWDPCRMHFTADDLEWFSIEEEFVLAKRKNMFRLCDCERRNEKNKKDNKDF